MITGGPGSGKTTLIHLLEERGYHTAPEHARYYIDCELIEGRSLEEIRADQASFQRDVLLLQMEHESNTPPEQLTFFDRGIPDTLAYQRFHHLQPDSLMLQAIATCNYKKTFMLDLLPLVSDYARSENEAAQQRIQELLIEVYNALPFPLVHIPVLPPNERLEFLLAQL